MQWNDVSGVAALAVSVVALTVSTLFAARQAGLMRRANYVPVLIEQLSKFQSLEFNDNCHYVCMRLRAEHVFAIFHTRIIRVWNAIEPFVLTERASDTPAGTRLMCHLEEFARRARATPENIVDELTHGRR